MTAVSTLISRARRRVGDYPQRDALLAAVSTTTATTLSVATNTLYRNGMHLSIDDESMLVTGVSGSTGVTVVRGYLGSTAVTHAVGAAVLVDPMFSSQDYLDGLNEGLRMLWPFFYEYVEDNSLTALNQTSDYTLPAPLDTGRLLRVRVQEAGATALDWYEWRQFEVYRDPGGMKLHFTNWPPIAGAAIKLIGIAPFTTDLTMTGNLPTGLDDAATPCLITYACYYVIAQAETRRNRQNRAQNIGPGGTPAQVNSQQAQFYLNQFLGMTQRLGRPWPSSYTRRRI